jgi:peptidyl-dipeptidase Dcp
MTLASCDSRKTAGENPFFTEWDTPHGVPPFDKILPEHFMPAFERGMSLHEAEIDAITSNKDEATFENTILAYDDAGQMLAQTELVFGMLCAAETNDRMQALQEQAMPLLAAHRDKIRLDDKLFVRVKEVYDRRAALGLDAEQMRLLQKTYDSFVRAGALLDAEQKARPWDVLVVMFQDRLGRDAARVGLLLSDLHDADVRVYEWARDAELALDDVVAADVT